MDSDLLTETGILLIDSPDKLQQIMLMDNDDLKQLCLLSKTVMLKCPDETGELIAALLRLKFYAAGLGMEDIFRNKQENDPEVAEILQARGC